MIFKSKPRIHISKLTHLEYSILQQLMLVMPGVTSLHYVVDYLVNKTDTVGFKQGLIEMGEMIEQEEQKMAETIGKIAVCLIKKNYRHYVREYVKVRGCVTTAQTQEHLEIAASMIKNTIEERWCAFQSANELRKMMQVRQVELQCFTDSKESQD